MSNRFRMVLSAALAVASIALTSVGVVLPVVPFANELLTGILAVATAVFGWNAETEAYMEGLFDQVEDLLDGDGTPA